MIPPYLGCESAREMLEAFVDGELPVPDQVALESHLRWCSVCSARIEDLQLIGGSIRSVSAATAAVATEDLPVLATIQSDVLTRVRAEHDVSLPVRVRSMFEDMRFLWPALGATAALVIGLMSAVALHDAASAADPASFANMIQTLARQSADRRPQLAPLSSYYPVQLDALMMAPRPVSEGPALDSLPESDAVFALSAVVTRDGRVANYELLQSVRDGVRRRDTAARSDEVDALLDAVLRSRFEPAQDAGGGAVTVRVVWLLARTTVKPQVESVVRPISVEPVRPAAPRPARS